MSEDTQVYPSLAS